jgi:TPR repeat protein
MRSISLQAGRGGPPDPAEAAIWLTRAAQAGLAPAMVRLAEAYHTGRGVPPSDTDAMHWYAEGARLGAVRGQLETARYKLAPGPGHDAAGAYFWMEVAALHPGPLQAAITALDQAAANELTPLQQAEIRSRAVNWQTRCPAITGERQLTWLDGRSA